jgi:hypothetical protein
MMRFNAKGGTMSVAKPNLFNGRSWIVAIAVCATFVAVRGECAKTYQFTGTITELGHDSITVTHEGERFEFDRKDLNAGDVQHLKKGDSITVFYRMEAQRVTPPQKAGEARPGESAPSKEHILQDDRVYYNARNAKAPLQPSVQQPSGEKAHSSG